MLRDNVLLDNTQIEAINECTSFLVSELATLPPDDTSASVSREEIVAQLAIHRAVLAPIRRLPVELLSDIFFRLTKKTPLRSLQVAATLSRVCGTWRKVAHGHAALWTKVVVETLGDFDEYCDLFLPLTKTVPLELRCDNSEILGDLWDRITPYASRWRRITLEARPIMLSDLHVLHMERLERLVVFTLDAPISSDLSMLDFIVAPRLRHVGLTLDELQSERQIHVPATRSLTSIEITSMAPFSVTLALPLLRACADTLQSLTLRVGYPLEGPDGSYPTNATETFVMKALARMVLFDPACALLNHISAPVIDELVLGNVPEYGTRSLMGFLKRDNTAHHLESLRIYTVEEREVSAWVPCLLLMHNLRNLYFDELLSNPEFLEQMFLEPGRPRLLPSLKNIAIVEIFHQNPDLQGIIARMCGTRAKFTHIRGQECLLPIGWITEKV